jgi:hypothetical protein
MYLPTFTVKTNGRTFTVQTNDKQRAKAMVLGLYPELIIKSIVMEVKNK